MQAHVRLDRWFLGLYGLALLRGWPFEESAQASARMQAMHDLLHGDGPEVAFQTRDIDVLDIDAAYHEWAETYDEPNPLIAAEERMIDQVVSDFPLGQAADIATGTGRIAAKLVALGHETVAVDSSAAMLQRASLNVPDARLLRADLLHLPLADASMDLITCGLALTHLPDPSEAIAAFGRCLRPGGNVVISDIHPMFVATGGHAFFKREDGSRGVTRNVVHWAGAYVSAARESGLTVERCIDVFVDEALIEQFGLIADAEPALIGLPFATIWEMAKRV